MPKKKKATKLHPVTAYAQAVLDGEIVTGRLVKLAAARHMRDLKEGHKRGIHFSEDNANHAVEFFPQFLIHNEGVSANKHFDLSDHQVFIVGSLFGWLKADGFRRYRRAYIEIAKGAGKTPLSSGMLLYGLTMDGELGGELYCSAVARKQAEIAFRDCKNMAEKSAFADRLIITEHNIAYPATNSFIRPVSSEAKSLDGLRVFMCIMDEVHEHRDGKVINKMVAGNKGRMQPLNIEITNSGWDRTSICWQHHEYSKEILEQVAEDDNWFAYISQLDACEKCIAEGKGAPQDDCENCDHWWDEAVWTKANPNLGVSPTLEYLRGEVTQALRMPAKALDVKRLNFCIWTEQAAHWMPMDEWDACGMTPVTYDSLRGRRCYGGIDLGDTSDTTSMVLAFPPTREDEPFALLTFVWIPSQMARRTGKERERFQAWISKGYINPTEGNRIDHRWVARQINQYRKDFRLSILAMDPYHADNFAPFLEEEAGFTVEEKEAELYRKPLLFKFHQGMSHMASPTQSFIDHVLRRKIAHGGHPVLRWMVGNTVVSPDSNGNVKPEKGKSTEKIDGTVAAIMALDVAIRNPVPPGSVYEERGFLVL